jgi:CHAD domain-containing protein
MILQPKAPEAGPAAEAAPRRRLPLAALMKAARPSKKSLRRHVERVSAAQALPAVAVAGVEPARELARPVARPIARRELEAAWLLPGGPTSVAAPEVEAARNHAPCWVVLRADPRHGAALHNWLAAPQRGRRAIHFDSSDGRLQRAGFALALVREAGGWSQLLTRRGQQHRVELGPSLIPPDADIGRHADTALGAQLEAKLGGAPLQCQFTQLGRCSERVVRSAGARIRAELNVTIWRSGASRRADCQLRLQLDDDSRPSAGPARDALLALAARLARRFGMWLDARPPQDAAGWLARGRTSAPAVAATRAVLHSGMAPATALGVIVDNCLEQIVPNLADLGSGDAEHLHQARVGLRRLRSALRTFGAWSDRIDPAWEPALGQLFRRLGASRDRDMLAESVLPQLRAAGAPVGVGAAPADAVQADAAQAVRDPGVTALLLALTGFTWAAAQAAPTPATPLREAAAVALKHLCTRLRRDATRFRELDDAQRHRARKRLKRLRYGLEATAGVQPRRKLERFLGALRPAQERIGEYNDLLVAEASFRAAAERDPGAWFALGWIASRRPAALDAAVAALRATAKAKAPW